MNKKVKKCLTNLFPCVILDTETIENHSKTREEMSGLIIPVRADGTIAPYPVSVPSGGMSGDDLEGFLAAQGFEVKEEEEPRRIGFLAAIKRDKELRNESKETENAELAGDSRPL